MSNGTAGSTSNVITINNSIVAKNSSSSTTSQDLSKSTGTLALTVNGSLIGVNDGTGLTPAPIGSPDANGNLIGVSGALIDPQLGSLALNGGTTQSHALLGDSPAIDAGKNSLAVDQHGTPLSLDQPGHVRIFHFIVDMGAYELQSVATGPNASFTAATQSANESAGTVTMTIHLSAPAISTVTIPFTTSGTATKGEDYSITNSPLTIPAGATSATIQISIVNDANPEPNETVIVTLDAPTNAELASPSVDTLTIIDNTLGGNQAPTLENSGQPPVFQAKGPQVKILPNIIVHDPDSNTDLGQIVISLPAPQAAKNPDKIKLKGKGKVGTVAETTAEGRRTFTITIKDGVTTAAVQDFLRSITFSTKKEGLTLNHRDIQVQVFDRHNEASNVITQDIGVAG
jgi:hypothetical protein